MCNFGESIYRLCSFNFIKIVISSEFFISKGIKLKHFKISNVIIYGITYIRAS